MSLPDIPQLRGRLNLELGPQSLPGIKPDWLLMGSAMMYLYGLREEVGDIDLFVTPEKWGELIGKGWEWETPRAGDPPIAAANIDGIDVRLNAFFDWDKRHGAVCFEEGVVTAAFREVEFFRGFYCQSLSQLLTWKEWLAANNVHPKHGIDAVAIREYLHVG